MPDKLLILFDIDGTLLSAGGVFRKALAEALQASFGRTGPIEAFDFSGMTDPQIVRGLMRAEGLTEQAIDNGMVEALARYEAGLLPLLDHASVMAKPGAVALVDRLASDPRATLGLLTGNLEPCARAKLSPLGLNPFFAFGAFGSDHEQRSRLPAIAVERALRATGRAFAGKQIVIVGDSVEDVRCGQSLGVRSIAVASGKTAFSTLAGERPDVLLRSFADTEDAYRAIIGDTLGTCWGHIV
jgi:phosphoglycolate phosphatase